MTEVTNFQHLAMVRAANELKKSTYEAHLLSKTDTEKIDRDLLYLLILRMSYDLSISIKRALFAGMTNKEIRDGIKLAREVFKHSDFISRLQTWPRGYPGDFETIEQLYFAEPTSTNLLGFIMDEAAFNWPITQQHRNKINHQCEEIRKICLGIKNPKILIVASGGGIDAWKAQDALENAHATVVFNDIEEDAIDLVKKRCIEATYEKVFIPGNLFRKRKKFIKYGPYDLILCGGLFDYIEMERISKFIKAIYDEALKDNGEIFFTNLAVGNPYQGFIETVCDWKMIYRSEDDFIKAFKKIVGETNIEHWRDETKLAVFYRIKKEK